MAGLYSTVHKHREALETRTGGSEYLPLPAGDLCCVKRLAQGITRYGTLEPFYQLLQMPPKSWRQKYTFSWFG